MVVFIYPEFTPAGNIRLQEKTGSKLNQLSRRVNRRATIDGGAFLDDQGFTDADRTLEIITDKTETALQALRSLIAIYAVYQCVTSEGVFKGTIQNIIESDNELTINFLVTKKEI